MRLSSRVLNASESVTLKVNEQITKLSMSGKHVVNMTAGQLPFKPAPEFIKELERQLNFLKSYQYGPNAGFGKLREKLIDRVEKKRDINLRDGGLDTDCVIGNGSKQVIYNILGALLDPADEVVLLTPYWVSYPEMVKFWEGKTVEVRSHSFDAFTPPLDEIEKAIGPKTKVLIVNSPNNPAGIHYSDNWMKDFARVMLKHPD